MPGFDRRRHAPAAPANCEDTIVSRTVRVSVRALGGVTRAIPDHCDRFGGHKRKRVVDVLQQDCGRSTNLADHTMGNERLQYAFLEENMKRTPCDQPGRRRGSLPQCSTS